MTYSNKKLSLTSMLLAFVVIMVSLMPEGAQARLAAADSSSRKLEYTCDDWTDLNNRCCGAAYSRKIRLVFII
jgi:hypothetical protein